MKIKKTYKEFIKESNEYIDEMTINDIFIDLIDMDFTLSILDGPKNWNSQSGSKWYIELRKNTDSKYDYIENDYAYGVSNLEPMKVDITKVLDILQSAKETLNSMEYTIGYEIEFNFNDQSQFYVACHIQHNDTIGQIIESKKEIKSELKGNDYQMVSGIIDILKKVKDKENRMEIAKDMISQFKREDIKFDYDKFLDSIK